MNILYILKYFIFVLIFFVQASSVSPRSRDPVRIRIQTGFLDLGRQWNVWHQKYENKKEGFETI